jgi:S-adenosylmethionine hydrolase
LEIIDGTHQIPKFDTWSASYRLFQYLRFWPKGTIFVSVVNPGVGTKRRACVALTTDGYIIITPDNGTLTHIKHFVGIQEVRQIDETVNRLPSKNTEGVSVFHGRDVFSYCAAKLASGKISFEEVGPQYDLKLIVMHAILEPVFHESIARGVLEINDPHFGNIWTNFPLKDFLYAGFKFGERLHVTIRHEGQIVFSQKLLFEKSFGFAETGESIIYNNELNRIGLAVNHGSFSDNFKIGYGPQWQVEIIK